MADTKSEIRWSTTYAGPMIKVEQTSRPNGEIWERAVRSPGVRLIIRTGDGKFILTKEHRYELNTEDYRLPGGKVFDTLNEYMEFTSSDGNIEEAARKAAIKEAAEEVGIINPGSVRLVEKSVLGATVQLDLYVFEISDFEIGKQNLQGSEKIEPATLSKEEIDSLIKTGKFNEDRMVPVLMRYFS